MEQITGVVKHYEWGCDINSLVAQYAKSGNHMYDLSADKFAELWIGTHTEGIFSIDGKKVSFKLPFLLKILSINKTLSIQVHPNKNTAMELHSKFPEIYKDDNPKPEIAIPITHFEALAGLLSNIEVSNNLLDYPELINFKTIEDLLLSNYNVDLVIDRITCKKYKSSLDNLIIRLNKQYPHDIGVLCPIYMKYYSLDKGDSLFIPVGCPHAYISGDIIEVMMCSDNVVRVALTNKFKDIDTLLNIMTYEQSIVSNKKIHFIENFITEIIEYKKGNTLFLPKNSVMFIINSISSKIKNGTAFYIKKNIEFTFEDDLSLVLCH